MSAIDDILGDYTKRNLKKNQLVVEQVKDFMEKIEEDRKLNPLIKTIEINGKKISKDLYFIQKTYEFRRRLNRGETINDILPEALAVISLAIKKTQGYTPYDVQLEAAVAMLNSDDNVIVEMKTGEGKTLVQMLSAYLKCLEATSSPNKEEWKSVHILTANEYLAQRDQNLNRLVFYNLGLSSAYVPEISKRIKADDIRKRYGCDIIYATPSTVAFDYLNDNRVYHKKNKLMTKKMYHAILDEADDTLIDQAINPLILIGKPNNMGNSKTAMKLQEKRDKEYLEIYEWAAKFVAGINRKNKEQLTHSFLKYSDIALERIANEKFDKDFKESDTYTFLDRNEAILSERISKEIFSLSDNEELNTMRYKAVQDCIIAKYYLEKGKDYEIKGNKVELIGTTTGRILKDNRFDGGLQEALEANAYIENPNIEREISDVVLAKCTYPDFFSQYEDGISGMTGTSDEEELKELYGLQTYKVKTNKPLKRVDLPRSVYFTKKSKYKAILREIRDAYIKGQPVLVGTTNIHESDKIAEFLDALNIKYQRLDAVNDQDEAKKIVNAGKFRAVTIATNMAGRGTDIKLDDEALKAGGLYVIGVSQNRLERVDRQLIGRSGRQGQIGKSKFFSSLEDDIIASTYGEYKFVGMIELNKNNPEEIKSSLILKTIDKCQSIMKSKNSYERIMEEKKNRKVFNEHKKFFYSTREQILDAENPKELGKILIQMVNSYSEKVSTYSKDDLTNLLGHIINVDKCFEMSKDKRKEYIFNSLQRAMRESIIDFKSSVEYVEYVRKAMLGTIDAYYIEHMENLENVYNNAMYARDKDPLEKYKEDADRMLIESRESLQNEIITYISRPDITLGTYKAASVQMK